MSSRKIKINIDRENVGEVLKNLDLNSENLELIIDVKENREAFEYLYRSPYISNWDFVDNNRDIKKPVEEEKRTGEKILEKKKDLAELKIEDFNDLAFVVEFFWSIGKNYWQNPEFYNMLEEKLASTTKVGNNLITGINHLMIKTLIEYYYSGKGTEFGIKDTLEKLKSHSQEIFRCETISEVTKILYGKNKRA